MTSATRCGRLLDEEHGDAPLPDPHEAVDEAVGQHRRQAGGHLVDAA